MLRLRKVLRYLDVLHRDVVGNRVLGGVDHALLQRVVYLGKLDWRRLGAQEIEGRDHDLVGLHANLQLHRGEFVWCLESALPVVHIANPGIIEAESDEAVRRRSLSVSVAQFAVERCEELHARRVQIRKTENAERLVVGRREALAALCQLERPITDLLVHLRMAAQHAVWEDLDLVFALGLFVDALGEEDVGGVFRVVGGRDVAEPDRNRRGGLDVLRRKNRYSRPTKRGKRLSTRQLRSLQRPECSHGRSSGLILSRRSPDDMSLALLGSPGQYEAPRVSLTRGMSGPRDTRTVRILNRSKAGGRG